MPQNDRSLPAEVIDALRLLTRLPLPASPHRPSPRAAWAWPLAGALVGLAAVSVGALALPVGAGFAAALLLATQAMLTGAMHEDGLADTADGLWGGWDRARRLAIMKDSHIGTYGVMALLLVTLIRWTALVQLLDAGAYAAILAVAMLSRTPMAWLMAVLPNARGSGLSNAVGAVPVWAAATATALAAIAGALAIGPPVIGIFLAVAILTLTLGALAKRKIGGQTGDILGASQQLAEAIALSLIAGRMLG